MLARIIVADPPWPFNDRRETRRDNPAKATKFGIGVQRRYSAGCMSKSDLFSLGDLIGEVTTPDAYLFMWATCSTLTTAMEVMASWGFDFKTVAFTWVKTTKNRKLFSGPGRYTASNSELILLGRRKGQKCWHSNLGWRPNQIVLEPHPRGADGKIIHSRKPSIFMESISKWLKEGPRLELFATQETPGWVCLGHEISGRDIREDLAGIRIIRFPV